MTMQLLLTINPRGKVAKARVLRSLGPVFDDVAVKALQACAFVPGTRDGKPFTDRVPFVVEFKPGLGA